MTLPPQFGDGNVIIPQENRWSQSQFDRAVRNTYRYTDQNYDEALYAAAREGKPIVVSFGSRRLQDTQRLVEQTIPQAQRSNPNAIYVFIDLDRVDRNSAIGRYADRNVRNEGLPYTTVFSMVPGQDGRPQPESPLMTAWGSRSQIASLINQHIGYGLNNMRRYRGQFRVPQARPREQARREENADDPFSRANEARRESSETRREREVRERPASAERQQLEGILQDLNSAAQCREWRQAEEYYRRAISAAERINPQTLEERRQTLQSQMAAEARNSSPNPNRTRELSQEMTIVQRLQEARSFTCANLGLACIRWGFREVGEEWLAEAALRDPNIFGKQTFQQALRRVLSPSEDMNQVLQRLISITRQRQERLYNSNPEDQDPLELFSPPAA